MMDRSAAGVAGRLIIDVQATGADTDHDVSDAGMLTIKQDAGTKMPLPPIKRQVDVACKYMGVVKIYARRHT